jgi:diguanylate cyclase (GGDEF)-like protein/PAS domain S-box-containing protein
MSVSDVIAVLLIAAAAAATALCVLGLYHRALPGGPALASVSGCLAVWCVADAVQIETTDPDVKRATVNVVYAAICGLVLSFWWLVTRLAGAPRMTPVRWALVAAPVPVTLLLTVTGWGGLMFEELRMPDGAGAVDNVAGPWFGVHTVWAYALIVAGLLVFARATARGPARYRGQRALMVGAVLVPLAVNAVVVSRVVPLAYDLTPLAMLATVGGFAWSVRYQGLIDAQIGVLPVARDRVVHAMRDGVVVVDRQGRVLDINPAAARLLGVGETTAVGWRAEELMPGWEGTPGTQRLWEHRILGHPPRTLEATITAIDPRDDRSAVVVILRDVTDRRRAELAMQEASRLHLHRAQHDPLTGLPNRALLFQRLEAALRGGDAAGGGDPGGGPGLLILDLDGFKDLNDTFGHRAGDEVLTELGGRMTRASGPSATVARLAGDEFAVLLPDRRAGEPMSVALRVLDALQVPFSVAGTEISLSGSIGVAIAPEHGRQPDDLVHAADVAMYHAKRTSAGVALYAPSSDVRRPDRLILRQELRRAIASDELEAHYQPQCTPDGRMVGAEALVRWRHPERGLLAPRDFLPFAEETDLICELTDAMLRTALRDAGRWAAGTTGLRVSVNLAARDLRDPGLADRVGRALRDCDVPGTVLTLEVTENALAVAPEARDRLEALRDAGVRVSLDDFGTGFAPLATLRETPVDELKIDRRFVSGISVGDRDAALVSGLIRLGHDLGLTVVAEGVETTEGADRLRDLDCDVLQGHLIGRPRPARGSRRPASATAGGGAVD